MSHLKFKPESLMMSYGHHAADAQGAVKAPLYQTSTFAFRSAEEGKAFFELAYGLREPQGEESPGMIYSRLNNPNLDIVEQRLCLWDNAEEAAVFSSGMAAISTVMFEFLHPGDVLLYSSPLYGGTMHFITEVLAKMGIGAFGFTGEESPEAVLARLRAEGLDGRVAMVYIESPANPTNLLTDIEAMSLLAAELSQPSRPVLTVVDNTYMGPAWQHPLELGANLVLYSATKYLNGHSDLIAGAVLGNKELMERVKIMRTFLGNMASPWASWMLMRSLETLSLRMEKQCSNARLVAQFLNNHPLVERVNYLGLLTEEDGEQYDIYRRQCTAPGAMISIYIKGGENEAFAFLNGLKLFKLAVSLGSTESLAQHPATMTHAGLPTEVLESLGVNGQLVRLSIGIEHPDDLILDLNQALAGVEMALEEALANW
ncbi:MAG: cystathionine gamma-synthase family protein [Phaeodactylibacter sp.]|nr:cystathionine gamma-synthase family protein [Phaeodactylibacter sp.]MCB9273206.1 cystathionine gamma-synthase family protein [Lewinellaceae bacterium]